ncbi:histidine decarboxylase [Chitinophagaceae bacterium LB-8]|uniref:Histidine decarboxylase n=1 Tax=Paraflavisolibacter caeni TaxID=2982496 RepID=A0A9X2XNL7_9BACT|nr:histidine decarboxylase [Paraflavisolibacter caeni]MCU7548549.1 histidine decarboxylase [Paraflavisolibacter caeni]
MNYTDKELLERFMDKVSSRAKTFIGYPASSEFDYSELYPLLKYCLNNVGDPLVDSHSDMHSKYFERDVISFFAELFKAPVANWWGYVTNGGSEGNLYALYLARELYPEGMVYYSEATHYSVQKNVHLLNMPSIVIRATENGEMDYEDLRETIQLHRHRPVIILANIGTTMTEAKDDIVRIREILKTYAIKNSYIHCDAALAGTYLSLLDRCRFDFTHGADSITISGHKFIGSPIPCGVVLVKKNYKDRIGRSVSYIGTLDTTITGSRNAITPVFLWYAIKKIGKQGLKERAVRCLELAAYAEQRLQEIGIAAWRNPDAITVVFPQPAEKICRKWQLASENGFSHIICMPGVTKQQIDSFVDDLMDKANQQFLCVPEYLSYSIN